MMKIWIKFIQYLENSLNFPERKVAFGSDISLYSSPYLANIIFQHCVCCFAENPPVLLAMGNYCVIYDTKMWLWLRANMSALNDCHSLPAISRGITMF